MTDDERQVSALVGAWMAASNAGDPTAVLALMKDDVIFMISGLRAYVRNHIHITLTQQCRQPPVGVYYGHLSQGSRRTRDA